MISPRSILITGASSGIGAALARHYAGAGIDLALTGRNEMRLAETAEACRAAGARVTFQSIDVRERDALAGWIATVDQARPIDLVIANAGISAGTGGGGEREDQAARIFAVNVNGVFNTVFPVIAPMVARGRGHIAIISSLASFRGFPGAPAYCASKAAIRFWGEALRGELLSTGVEVSVVCPGYIVTPMTAVNKFTMPMLMPVERAASIIARGIGRRRARIAFPWPIYALVRLLAALPPGAVDRMLARLPRK
jgi:short-subunit dehydrogenase